MYVGKLTRKLLNPWLYIDISLFSDRPKVIETIDRNPDIRKILRRTVRSWDEMIHRIQFENLVRLSTEIANAKISKGIEQNEAMKQTTEAAGKHPEFLKFRLGMTMTFDSSQPEDTLDYWTKVIGLAVPRMGGLTYDSEVLDCDTDVDDVDDAVVVDVG